MGTNIDIYRYSILTMVDGLLDANCKLICLENLEPKVLVGG